jgi:hypothetical protein
MAKRDPREVLGVDAGASATQIKAAWRRLARAHHPDLTGDDPAASRVATRQMAEINDAYAALTRTEGSGRGRGGTDDEASFDATAPRRGGPPRPKPSPPVTGRVDMSATYRPRNQVAGNPSRRVPLPGQPPLRGSQVDREPPRASTPTGPPVKGRIRHFRRPTPPSLDRASNHMVGQIAAFEPSYIDWLAGTVTRDPDLVAAARVIRDDLDRRGVLRRTRPTPERPGRSA